MTPERWQMVRGILQSAMELRPEERGAFLDRECVSDPSLRQDVEGYLAVEGRLDPDFLESPAAEQVAMATSTAAGDAILVAGTRLGPYELQAMLGAGGMGEVYRARDTRLNRTVAIKVIPTALSSDPARVQRFEREARAIAALQHPNICTLFDVGHQDGTQFLVMEYLEGETMAARLRKGRLSLDLTLRYGIEVADALDAAHRKGIVHRDLKPGNIFISAHGEAKVLDFGLAKLDEPEPEVDTSAGTATSEKFVTTPGVAMGTAPYMSPEQARGEDLDARTDIFSLGAVLYEMSTGKMAFPGKTTAIVHKAILDENPPPPSQVVPTLPDDLDHIVGKTLEKDRDLRHQSAADLRADLNRLKRDSSSGRIAVASPRTRGESRPPTVSRSLRKAGWFAASSVVLVTIAVVAWWFISHSNFNQRNSRAPAFKVSALTAPGEVIASTISFDGRYVAYVNYDAGKTELRLLQVATRQDVQLLDGGNLWFNALHFSPDGNFIYFLRQLKKEDRDAEGVYRIAALGGPVLPLASDSARYSVTVSPDGKTIAYIAESGTESYIIGIDPEGGNRRILAKRPVEFGFGWIEWSHSMNIVAAAVSTGGAAGAGLARVDMSSGLVRVLAVSTLVIGQPAWSPDDRKIYAAVTEADNPISQIWAFDAQTGVRNQLTSNSTRWNVWFLSTTAAGDILAATYSTALSLLVVNRLGQVHSIPASKNEGVEAGDVAWVDNKIVTSNGTELILHDPDKQTSTRLATPGFYPRIVGQLARCGKDAVVYLAAESNRPAHIFRTDIATGSTKNLTDGAGDSAPTCSPDGSIMVYVNALGEHNRNVLVCKWLESGKTAEIYQFESSNLVFLAISPNGKNVLLSVQFNDGKPRQWAILPITGGDLRQLHLPIPAGEVREFSWAPDGKTIVYVQNDDTGVGNIWTASLDGVAKKRITNFRSDLIRSFDIAPDNRLVFSRGTESSDLVLLENVK
jgi:serine/threonine protein kinase